MGNNLYEKLKKNFQLYLSGKEMLLLIHKADMLHHDFLIDLLLYVD